MHVPWLDDEGDPVSPTHVHWLDPLILLTDAAARLTRNVDTLLKARANIPFAEQLFQAEMSAELETILEEDEDG